MADIPQNRLLRALGERDRKRILDQCDRRDLVSGDTLVKDGDRQKFIYFPHSGVVSTVAVYSDGTTIEMATTGREGFIGIGPLLGDGTSLETNLVQIAGTADVLPAADFNELVAALPELKSTLLAYTKAYHYQLLVSGACNGAHNIRQRLARWLLMMNDRSDEPHLQLTHEFLAAVLGVHRPSLSKEAEILQDQKLIEYNRGSLVVLDVAGLEDVSCECYQLVRTAYSNLLPFTYA